MGNEGRLPADGADRVRDEAANVAGEAVADCAGQVERTNPTGAVGSVRNEAGDIEGAVVQAGSVYGGINLHLPAPRRVVDEKRRQERRERLKTCAQNTGALLVLVAFLTLSDTLPWAQRARKGRSPGRAVRGDDPVMKRGSDENSPSLEAATKAVCRSEPGWDNGTYTYTTSIEDVFCLAHN